MNGTSAVGRGTSANTNANTNVANFFINAAPPNATPSPLVEAAISERGKDLEPPKLTVELLCGTNVVAQFRNTGGPFKLRLRGKIIGADDTVDHRHEYVFIDRPIRGGNNISQYLLVDSENDYVIVHGEGLLAVQGWRVRQTQPFSLRIALTALSVFPDRLEAIAETIVEVAYEPRSGTFAKSFLTHGRKS